jgi:hypothetical protein
VEPLSYLTDVLERITSGEAKTTDLKALLPWNWPGHGVPLRCKRPVRPIRRGY